MFQMALPVMMKSIQNCRSYSLDKNLTSKCDFDLGPTWTNILNGTFTNDGEQLCHIILKSIDNRRNYGPDEFGTVNVTTMSR